MNNKTDTNYIPKQKKYSVIQEDDYKWSKSLRGNENAKKFVYTIIRTVSSKHMLPRNLSARTVLWCLV